MNYLKKIIAERIIKLFKKLYNNVEMCRLLRNDSKGMKGTVKLKEQFKSVKRNLSFSE